MTAPMPDWGYPLAAGFWQAVGRPGLAVGLPTGLALLREDGRPGYALHAFRIEGGGDLDGFGVLSMRFVAEDDAAARTAALRAGLPGMAVSFPGLGQGGFLRFRALAALEAGDLARPVPLVSAGQGLSLTRRLDAAGLALMRQLRPDGTLPLLAEVVTPVTGLAVRVPGVAQLDGSALAARLAGGRITRKALVGVLRAGAWPDAVQGAAPEAAEALADRITAAALELAPPEGDAAEPEWRLSAGALQGAVLTLALDDATLAPRAFALRSATLTAPEVSDATVTDPLVMLPTGLVVLTLAANVPEPRVGADVIGLDLVVPAHPPERPQTIRRTVTFARGDDVATLPLRLAPTEPLRFDWRAFTVAMEGGAGLRREGAWRTAEGDHLTVPAEGWPMGFLRAEATPSLLAQADVALEWQGHADGGSWRAALRLSQAAPRMALARPLGLTGGTLSGQLLPRDGGAPLPLALADTGDLWLDLAQVPEAGPQRAAAAAVGTGPLPAFDYLGEDETADPAAPRRVRPVPGEPPTVLRWLPQSPFRAGFRGRWATDPPGPWSPVLPPGTALSIHAGDATALPWPGGAAIAPDSLAATFPDIELLAEAPGHYRYRARAPRLQPGPAGVPVPSVIAFGTGLMVQLTAEWTVDTLRLAALAAALARRDGAAPRLDPAQDSVAGTDLLLGDGQGDPVPVASGTALGAPPQTSLLAVTLAGEPAARLKRALSGERGLARLRYRIDAIDPASSAALTLTTAVGAGALDRSATSFTENRPLRHAIIAEADLADLLTPRTIEEN